MQWKLNLTWVICLQMGKTTEAKPHWGNLRSPLPRIYYYQNKLLQVKGILVPNTNLQLNPYPNTQLDLYYNGNLSVQCTNPIMWLNNNARIPIRDYHTNLRKMLATKFFSSSKWWRSKSSLVKKPLAETHQLL